MSTVTKDDEEEFDPTPYDWGEPVLWICPRCENPIKTKVLNPRCTICGFKEGT